MITFKLLVGGHGGLILRGQEPGCRILISSSVTVIVQMNMAMEGSIFGREVIMGSMHSFSLSGYDVVTTPVVKHV